MNENNVKKNNVCRAKSRENKWCAQKIKAELNSHIELKSHIFNHFFRYDHEDKYYFIYDNECHLFVFDEKIELRSDLDNVYSTDKTFSYQIKEAKNIHTAYAHFVSMTMEDEEKA